MIHTIFSSLLPCGGGPATAANIEETELLMLRLAPIEPAQAGKVLRGMLDRDDLRAEDIPNFLRILAKSPASARAYARVEETLAKGRLSRREREQIALAVAEINGANYCLSAHAAAGRSAGLTEAEVLSARRAAAADAKGDQMLRFTQSLVLQRGEISDADLGALRQAGFSDGEIIEIVANIAQNIFANYLTLLSKTKADSCA
jgi:uncharacterized peroxidase-related enzyme